jgi:predicted TIM-barrel fold metal-dependent hydrolase
LKPCWPGTLSNFYFADCGNPDVKQPPSKVWETGIRDLAKNQNLSCKLSGLFTQETGKHGSPRISTPSWKSF